MAVAEVMQLVERYRAGWFGRDVDAIMATVSDDVVFHNLTAGERVEGATAFRTHVADIHERWPDLSFREHGVYVSVDTGVVEWTATGTAVDGRRMSGTESTSSTAETALSAATLCTRRATPRGCSINRPVEATGHSAGRVFGNDP